MTPRQALRWLGSVWLTVIILLVMTLILIAANVFSGYDISVGSLRRDWYGSWWFLPLMGLLMVNLVVCTVIRTPWRFWQWGFLITHCGVLTLMIGATISFQFKIYGDMRLVEGTAGNDFSLEDERELVLRTADGKEHRMPVRINPYVRSRPGASKNLGNNLFVYIDEFVPNVAEEPVYEPAPDGHADVVEVRATLGKMTESMFIPANQIVRYQGGLIGLAYLGGNTALLDNMAADSGEQGTLVLEADGEKREIDVKSSIGQSLKIGKREFRITRFIANFVMGEKEPEEDPHGGDRNPTVLLDVTVEGKTATYYVFANMPEMSPMKKGGHMEKGDFAASLRYTAKVSMVFFAAVEGGQVRWLVTSKKGDKQSGVARPGEKFKHPFMPMDFFFEVVRRIENAAPTVKETEPEKGRPRMPAVKVRLSKYPSQESAWVGLFGNTTMSLDGERVDVTFQPAIYPHLGFHVKLKKFHNPPHEGTQNAMKFESDLEIFDPASGRVVNGKTGVNYPFAYRGWVFYQSSYVPGKPATSILQVSHDPGKRILYLGFIMTASGTLFMFYLRGLLVKLVKPAQSATDKPMSVGEQYLWLFAGTLATIAGIAVWLIFRFSDDSNGALWTGFGMAAAGVAKGFGLAFRALHVSLTHPGWALQLGHIASATWCINTAALVVFMWTQVGA